MGLKPLPRRPTAGHRSLDSRNLLKHTKTYSSDQQESHFSRLNISIPCYTGCYSSIQLLEFCYSISSSIATDLSEQVNCRPRNVPKHGSIPPRMPPEPAKAATPPPSIHTYDPCLQMAYYSVPEHPQKST